MKKYIIIIALLFATKIGGAQKYVLIDQTMVAPLRYTDDVSLKNTYKYIFVVEANHLKEFVSALNKVYNDLISKSKKHENLNFIFGNTKISSTSITIMNEERFDIMMKTKTEDTDVSMHLSNPKNSNAQNLFFINTWIDYINSYIK